MPVGSPRTHAGISIAIARDPALVRTVRLVAAAVARRASPSEDLVEEVRLAVGEACAVMVSGLTGSGDSVEDDDKVRLQMDIGDRLHVALACAGEGPASYDGNPIDPWALLRGLTDDLSVTTRDGGTAVAMSWPI
ncbi:MAG TPA: ATP-binding protein [Nocardioidaceae bacterium]|nr:ATP-binding protein [Nocardioidaceae bacterium]